MKRNAVILVLLAICGYAYAQTSNNSGTPTGTWTYTNYPLYGVEVTPHDTTQLSVAMTIRPDADGAVTARCTGSDSAITLNLVAGEFFPCQVRLVLDTGTDAITIHGFY